MLRPQIGCSTFTVFDFMRVPPPAASTITVRLSMRAVCHCGCGSALVLPG